jgi:membrane associated rhomboid family serine protease
VISVAPKGKVIGSIILTILWICCFLFIKPTLVFDFGGGVMINLLLLAAIIGLLVLVLYHIFYPSPPIITKLSLTVVLTLVWLALIIFYPFKDPNNTAAGAVGFFTLIGGLAVAILWVYFFCDELI